MIGGPAGEDTGVMILVGMLHRDKQVWGEDPETFDPDRFSPEKRASIPPNAYKPFGSGQRASAGSSPCRRRPSC